MTRYGMGSIFATVAALYNLFLIRQRILKNAIYLTKSNKPRTVKMMSVIVGSLYFAGLYCIWHIPSFFSEVAVRVYVSTEDVVTNWLMRRYAEEILLNDKRLERVLKLDGLKLNI